MRQPTMQTSEILFFEAHAAAQSLKNAWTRLASTYGCIKVLLTREKLTIPGRPPKIPHLWPLENPPPERGPDVGIQS